MSGRLNYGLGFVARLDADSPEIEDEIDAAMQAAGATLVAEIREIAERHGTDGWGEFHFLGRVSNKTLRRRWTWAR